MTKVTQASPVKHTSDPYAKGKLDGRATIAFNNVPAVICGSMYLLLNDRSSTSDTIQTIINTTSVLVLTWTVYLLYYLYVSNALQIIRSRISRALAFWQAGRRKEVRREIVELMDGQWGPLKFTLRAWIVVGMTIWFGRAKKI